LIVNDVMTCEDIFSLKPHYTGGYYLVPDEEDQDQEDDLIFEQATAPTSFVDSTYVDGMLSLIN